MKVLVAFLLSLLGCRLAEGRLLSKCELRVEFTDLAVVLDSDLVAKIICYVEEASGFNTSVVSVSSSGAPRHGDAPALYGVFQLSNLVACSDGVAPSPNICSVRCDDFLDGDISDDIDCLLKIYEDFVKNGFWGPHFDHLKQWFEPIFKLCRNKTYKNYLKECGPNAQTP
ncbi:alpha-lactalbumin [Clinocottus analis]|uniref:alpha-lactalbumin n=1 Tax=Clinocottus analis TaxID=304258 RepID=UPI0035C1BC80